MAYEFGDNRKISEWERTVGCTCRLCGTTRLKPDQVRFIEGAPYCLKFCADITQKHVERCAEAEKSRMEQL